MVSAIILAGGGGTRSGQSVPKQFLTINDIPIIVYTMRNMQEVEEIGKIVVVGPAGWENFISTYATQFGVTKLETVITGGKTRNESIYNGLCYLKNDNQTEKVCLIDGNRPLVPKKLVLEVIKLADQCDCALVTEPCYDSVFISEDGKVMQQNANREVLFRGTTPECARLETIFELYKDEKILENGSLSTSALAISKGRKVLSVKGSIKCFKITTAEDFELFKALLSAGSLNNII